MICGEDPELLADDSVIPLPLRWIRTSPQLVLEAEEKLFRRLRCSLEKLFVPITSMQGKLRTIVARNFGNGVTKGEEWECSEERAIPLVMVHGFASGVGLWCKNLDSLAVHRRVYALDVLGFGRSSRPVFPSEAEEVEKLFVDSLEEWRAAMNLEKFILLGHSFGGYLTTLYAMKHWERIAHLILVEPWGYQEYPFNNSPSENNSSRFRFVRNLPRLLRISNPLSLLRAAGPFGPSILQRARPDLRGHFDQRGSVCDIIQVPSTEEELALARGSLAVDGSSSVVAPSTAAASNGPVAPKNVENSKTKPLKEDIFDGAVALDYTYHINMQRPSGELGFKTLCSDVPYAKRPLIPRINALDASLPLTFIYGSQSWLDVSSGTTVRGLRPNSYVDVKTILGGGHQVYAQYTEEFNSYVNAVMHRVDAGYEFPPTAGSSDGHVERKEDVPDGVKEASNGCVSP